MTVEKNVEKITKTVFVKVADRYMCGPVSKGAYSAIKKQLFLMRLCRLVRKDDLEQRKAGSLHSVVITGDINELGAYGKSYDGIGPRRPRRRLLSTKEVYHREFLDAPSNIVSLYLFLRREVNTATIVLFRC